MYKCLAAAMVGLMLVGCFVESSSSSSITAGGFTVTIRPGAGMMTCSTSGDDLTVNHEDYTITITNMVLSVNGTSYGQVAKGDKILIDHGKVSVNGVTRNQTG